MNPAPAGYTTVAPWIVTTDNTGDPDRIEDLAAVRARFQEAKWIRWNLVRAVAS